MYLAILGLLTFAGIVEELKKLGGTLYAMGTFLSLLIIIAFVVGSFLPDFGKKIGIFSIPMLLLILIYDFFLSGRNLIIGSKHFGEPLEETKSRMDILTASIIVAPGYFAGIYIIIKYTI